MSDEQPPREPVLKPREDAKFKTVRRKEPVNPEDHEPVLMSEGLHHRKVKPPYFLFIFVLCGILIACWKIWMLGGFAAVDSQRKQEQLMDKNPVVKLRH